MPAIGKILLVFVLVLTLTRTRMQLGLALVIGGVLLHLWAGVTPTEAGLNVLRALGEGEFWLFLVITALIIEIGRFMSEPRNAEEIVSAARRWGGRHGRTSSLIVLPAVIGLVPMPAGALFSAPFVEQAGGEMKGGAAWKSAVNYWFRHIWEYWWPLYPGVIVAMSLFELEAWQFIATQILFTPLAVAAGYVFLIHPHVARLSDDSGGAIPGSNRRALFLLLPLLTVVVSLFVVSWFLKQYAPAVEPQSRKLLAVLAGLIAALAIVFRDERAGHAERGPHMFSSLTSSRSMNVLFSLAGVLIFKFMLTESGLLPVAGRELAESGVSPAYVVAALPFLAGFVTGIALGFTGVAFPLVVGILGTQGSGLTPLATLVLAYGFGYMGMMLSPVHLCLLVTRDYFHSSLPAVYRTILPCVGSVLAYCLLAHALLRTLGV